MKKLSNKSISATIVSKSKVPDTLQGVSKDKIKSVLAKIDLTTQDQIDACFALLDNKNPSRFSKAEKLGFKFSDGATTAHIAHHFGVLQRGGAKADREGRDYWLKPFWEIGAFEKVFFDSNSGKFVSGHPVPKSPNCAYRIDASFKKILCSDESLWPELLRVWTSEESSRKRKALQAQAAKDAEKEVGSEHADLIRVICKYYVPNFLNGYQVIYIDDGDGDRITDSDRKSLAEAGVVIGLGDAMPDILLWNKATDSFWIIEAVISDGEVDSHKISQVKRLLGNKKVGFTTAYKTWADLSKRQSKIKNLQPDTYFWIKEDATKHFLGLSYG